MSKRILDSRLPVMVYNPTGIFDIDYFRECHTAGALPVYDLEFFTDDEAIANIRKISGSDILFGVRVNGSRGAVIKHIRENIIPNLDVIVLYYNEDLPSTFEAPGKNVKVILELIDFHGNEEIAEIDPYAIIIRGFEAGGRVSRFTSFVLMQWYLENVTYPLIMHGGVGFHTTPGIFAAGCSAIVLDSQLYLMDESPVADNFKKLITTVEEGDSMVIGESLGCCYRFFSKLGTQITREIKEEESHLKQKTDGRELLYKRILDGITRLDNTTENTIQALFYLGQDGVYAKFFAARSTKLGEAIRALFEHVGCALDCVDDYDPMKEGTKLAREHETRYPIIQGPMANITDNADFANKVLENGCLPFFAMGNLPKDLSEKIISEGNAKVENFGCGLIGLTTNTKNFEAHLSLLKKYKVKYSLIAAGNAAQANDLEASGVKCFLHCPSAQMLENAINGGVRRFIFEGMEAGGHIGTLTSLVLWEVAMEKFLAQKDGALADQRIIFAGGVGTKYASDFISGMTSILSSKGAAVGISVGTTYIFTKEIVDTGAIKPLYQKLLLEMHETMVIGSTLGLSTRTVSTPYSLRIIEKEHEMIRENVKLGDRKHFFEKQNVGSLLIAAKAFMPDFEKLKKGGLLEYLHFDEKEAFEKGNFHAGQTLAFYNEQSTIETVHKMFFGQKESLCENLDRMEVLYGGKNIINDEIAVIGMGCLYPDAPDTATYWRNIVSKRYSIREISPERCNPDFYFSEDKKADDKAYTKIAGIVDYYCFDHKKYGYTDYENMHMSLSQKLILDAAMQAVYDAGYPEGKGLPKEKTAVIIGTCLTNELNSDLQIRQFYPEFVYHLEQIEEFKALPEAEKTKLLDHFKVGIAKGRLPKLPDGVALNVESARVAKHIGAEGINFTIDAACATSFAAIDAASKELLSGDSDVAIVGGVNTNHSPEAFVGFSKMGALSAEGSYPFDERAGGFILGEGAGVVVLKRMKHAIADGNKIYGVIKSVGASSDGKGRFIAAPSAEGQVYAIKRAYENMRMPINPDDIDYIEAHGTSTIAGDGTEMETIKSVYTGKRPKGISSVKSQIGHLLGGAGNAGLIKTLLAIQHKTLPPNGLFEKLSPKLKLDGTPLYIIKDAAEWKTEKGRKRRAAVSSYGFGGINYHVIIEEYDGDYKKLPRTIFSNPGYDHNDDRIVIAAIGTILPGAQNASAFWQNLEAGKNTISEPGAARFHNEYYAKDKDPAFNIPMLRMGIAKEYSFNGLKYKIPPMAMKVIDRSQFFALDAAGQVIEEAKLSDSLANGNKIAVMFGTTSSEKNTEQIIRTRLPFMHHILMGSQIAEGVKKTIADKFADRIRETYWKNTEDTLPGLLANITTGRVANFYNAHGANFVVDAECAASAVAISVAVKDLRAGTSDFVIAGGVDANLTPPVFQAFHLLKVISFSEARVFDKTSTGLIMSEGVALLGLTTLRHAKEKKMNIYGEIASFSFRSFPKENMIAPTENGFKKTFDDLYARGAVARSQIRYIDGFASSNKVVDKWELTALNKSFSKNTFLGNVKPEIGYYRAANPAVALAKLAMMAKNRTILPLRSYNGESSMLDGKGNIIAATERLSFSPGEQMYMAANFSGLGGLHGHAVVRTIPAWIEGVAAGPATVTVNTDVSAVAKTATQATVAAPQAQPTPQAQPAAAKGARVCALLSGQGSQSAGMMRALYESNPEIKKVLDRGEEIFKKERGYSILDIMFGNDARLNSTENTQVAVFLSTAALYDTLAARGFAPDLFIGHSIGEYSALYCAGILSFDEALKLIIARGAIMKQTADEKKGSIMVVFSDADTTSQMLARSGARNVWIANKNSNKQTAVSGSSEGIDAFAAFLKNEKVMCNKLNLSGAFHSPLFADASEKIGAKLAGMSFRGGNFPKVISNVTAGRYPSSEADVKSLLTRQVSSPVEFVKSVQAAVSEGVMFFVEIGPNKLLSNLLRDIPVGSANVVPLIDQKAGEVASLAKAMTVLENASICTVNRQEVTVSSESAISASIKLSTPTAGTSSRPQTYVPATDFNDFLEKNREAVANLLYAEYEKHTRRQENEFFKRAGFYGGKVVISGVSLGLPGRMNKVFEESNFDKILAGTNCIEPIDEIIKKKIVDRNIVRVHKDPQGNAKFLAITSTEEVIQLAGQLGYFNKKEYGIEYDNDITYDLAIAAGIEALKDAKIPLVTQFEKTSLGTQIAKGYALPGELQERTGVIFTAVYSGLDTLIREFERYAGDKFYRTAYDEFEKIFQFLMSNVKEDATKRAVTEWFVKVREITGTPEKYVFDRNIMFNILHMGNAHFAQMIRAKGPNTQSNAACASTTQAVGIANDWIRTGRCDRVIVIAGEAASSPIAFPLLGAAFLSLGAATVKKVVSEASKPFDADRNGLIIGAGAVGIVVEREDAVKDRGFNGQAELLGVHIKNSAFHGSRLDVNHVAGEMKNFIDQMEMIYDIRKSDYVPKLIFMSHETYTPARGGSADAEVYALRNAFPDYYKGITITNTKGFTGHTLSAGIEDCVLVKALQKGIAAPIANLSKIQDSFADLRFSKGEKGDYQYGIHFAAGFGSQFAIMFVRRIEENAVEGNDTYRTWLTRISGTPSPQLAIVNNALSVTNATLVSQSTSAANVSVASAPVSASAKAASAPVTPARIPAPTVAAPAPQAAVAAAPHASAGASAGVVTTDIKKMISEMTGYGEELLDANLDLEADLGIDTVKQVEIFGKVCEKFGIAVPEDIKLSELNTIDKLAVFISGRTGISNAAPAVAVSAAAPSVQTVQMPVPASSGALTGDVKKIIADMTGYGVEMLDTNLDLEADLGIDTVKQVEIFGKICEHYGIAVPEDLKLTEMNTIERLAAFIATRTGLSNEPVARSVPAAAGVTAVATSAVTTSAVSGASAPASVVGDVTRVIAEMTGYGAEMLDSNLDLEADLGIDTVKQVEIFGKICEHYGIAVPEDLKLTEMNTIDKLAIFIATQKGMTITPALQAAPAQSFATPVAAPALAAATVPAAQSGSAPTSIISDVKNVISEMTGYGVDMLDENLDLEADLGIDTVKQVEIFGKICEHYSIAVPEDLKLTEMSTIDKLAVFIATQKGIPMAALPTAMATAPVQTPAAPLATAAPSAPVAATATAAQSGSAPASIISDVKNVISEMTGYGVDMLDPGLDLEADLGIDTVKQVEIFGKICEHYKIAVPEDLKLTEMNTIEKLASFIAVQTGAVKAPAVAVSAPVVEAKPADVAESATHEAEPESGIKRFVLRTEMTAVPKAAVNIFEGKTILISDDGKGLSQKIAQAIAAKKGKAVLIGKGAGMDIDFSDVEAVDAATKSLAEKGGIDGFIHLAPLRSYFGGQKMDKAALDESVKSLFTTVKNLYPLLDRPGALIASLAFDSVVFPYNDPKAKVYPLFGAVSGLMKTANKELKNTLVKMVDFSYKKPAEKFDEIVDTFMNELCSGNTRVETGYRKGERYHIVLQEKTPDTDSPFVRDGDVVLSTGGERGITFEILKGMVLKHKVKIVMCAFTDINVAPEFQKPGITEQEIFNSLAKQMAGAKPVEIKQATARVLGQIEAVNNLKTLDSLGAKVDYYRTDVTDLNAIKNAVSKYERFDGVIHAAGLEISQLLPKKDMKTFNAVFNTKVVGALNLVEALEGKEYRYLTAFSSVAAKFGNDAQADYSAANEMLCKILQAEKRRFPDRVYKTYCWTAWGEVGMGIKESVMKFLTSKGLEFLTVKRGVQFFLDDFTDSKESELVVTSVVPDFDVDGIMNARKPEHGSDEAPFLGKVIEKSGEYTKVLRILDLKNDIFLFDHAINDVPYFLGSTGVETLAEAAASVVGKGKVPVEMRDFTIPYGIKILQGKPKDLIIDAKAISADEAECSIVSQFMKDGKAMGEPTLHYKGICKFAGKAPVAEKVTLPKLKKLVWDGNLKELLYHPKRLFMTGVFESIVDITGASDDTVITVVKNPDKLPFFANIPRPAFLIDPVVMDAIFQTCGFFGFIAGTTAMLPYRIEKIQIFGQIEKGKEYLCIANRVGRNDAEKTHSFNADLVDREGNLIIRITNFQMILIEKVADEFSVANKFRMV